MISFGCLTIQLHIIEVDGDGNRTSHIQMIAGYDRLIVCSGNVAHGFVIEHERQVDFAAGGFKRTAEPCIAVDDDLIFQSSEIDGSGDIGTGCQIKEIRICHISDGYDTGTLYFAGYTQIDRFEAGFQSGLGSDVSGNGKYAISKV